MLGLDFFDQAYQKAKFNDLLLIGKVLNHVLDPGVVIYLVPLDLVVQALVKSLFTFFGEEDCSDDGLNNVHFKINLLIDDLYFDFVSLRVHNLTAGFFDLHENVVGNNVFILDLAFVLDPRYKQAVYEIDQICQ